MIFGETKLLERSREITSILIYDFYIRSFDYAQEALIQHLTSLLDCAQEALFHQITKSSDNQITLPNTQQFQLIDCNN